jgi:hypothetical protein
MSYREQALTCPACSETLDPKQVGEAVIDVCPACGGIWVDWFDGELAEMVRGAPLVKGAGIPAKPGRSSCPRCQRPLDAETYLESGGDILRCADCAGAFVPRDAARRIANAGPEGPPPASDALSRLSAVLQRWFG